MVQTPSREPDPEDPANVEDIYSKRGERPAETAPAFGHTAEGSLIYSRYYVSSLK